MKFLPLIWAGMWRKPLRTSLTFLSIVVAFTLFAILQGLNAAFSTTANSANADRLVTTNKTSFTEMLPLADLTKIQAIPGIKVITYAVWFGGYYREKTQQLSAWVVDPNRFFDAYKELAVPPAQATVFKRTPDGMIVPSALAKKYNWTIGSQVPLTSILWFATSGAQDWHFRVVGIYPSDSEAGLVALNYQYFNKRRSQSNDTVGWFVIQVENPRDSADIAHAIDKKFANSPDETETITAGEFAQSFVRQYIDIAFVVSAIIGAVFFTLLFLTWNTFAQSVRERIPDIAVLKAIGIRDTTIAFAILTEAGILCLAGAAAGFALATSAAPTLLASFGLERLSPVVYAEGFAAAVLLALLAALVPAVRAQRLHVVDALTRTL